MGQEYDIVGGFISPEAKTELNNYISQLNSAAAILAKINSGGKAPKNEDPSVTVLKIAQAEERLNGIRSKNAAAEEARVQKDIANKSKQQNITEGYLNQLKMQVKSLTDDYMRLSEAEFKNAKNGVAGTAGKQTLDNLKKQREELMLAQQAYGNYSGSVGHYSTATKMLGINLGQVMKEMPNFAISARIGIMSLTNNLPMLAESFKAVAAEQKAMTLAQKDMTAAQIAALPNMGKIPSMFSMISRSIFGLTGIMSLAMVAMQLFGGDIIKWVGSLFKATKEVDSFTLSTRTLIKVMESQSGQAKSTIESITKLGSQIRKYGDDNTYAKEIVKDFNAQFNTHLKTIDEVKKAYPLMAKAAIDAAIKMQAAMNLINDSSNQMLRQQKSELILEQFSPEQVSQTESAIKRILEARKKYFMEVEKMTEDEAQKETNVLFAEMGKGNFVPNKLWGGFKNFVNEFGETSKEFAIAGGEYTNVVKDMESISGKGGQTIAQALINKMGSTKEMEILRKSIDELMQKDSGKGLNKDSKGIGSKDKYPKMDFMGLKLFEELKAIDPTTILFPKLESAANLQMMAIDKVLNYAVEQYDKGNLKYEEFEAIKTKLLQQAVDNRVVITEDAQAKIDKIEADANAAQRQRTSDMINSTFDSVSSIMEGFQQRYSDMLDKQMEKEKKINDEKYRDIDDRENAGIITKQKAVEEKLKLDAYVQGQEDELKKKKEAEEKRMFLFQQGLSLAQIVFNTAMAVTSPIQNPLYTLTPFIIGMGAIQAALVLGKAIPAFEQGGVMEKTGIAKVGEKRHELWVSPSGDIGITPDKPTFMNFEKGTKIYPDINKIDLMSIIGMSKSSDKNYDMMRLENVMNSIDKRLANQRPTRLSTQRLFDQLNQSDKYLSRKRGLMN